MSENGESTPLNGGGRGTRKRPQQSFEETDITSAETTRVVEGFMAAKAKAKQPKKDEKLAKDNLAQVLDGLELKDGEYRVGEFIITRRTPESTDVAFTRASNRIYTVRAGK